MRGSETMSRIRLPSSVISAPPTTVQTVVQPPPYLVRRVGGDGGKVQLHICAAATLPGGKKWGGGVGCGPTRVWTAATLPAKMKGRGEEGRGKRSRLQRSFSAPPPPARVLTAVQLPPYLGREGAVGSAGLGGNSLCVIPGGACPLLPAPPPPPSPTFCPDSSLFPSAVPLLHRGLPVGLSLLRAAHLYPIQLQAQPPPARPAAAAGGGPAAGGSAAGGGGAGR